MDKRTKNALVVTGAFGLTAAVISAAATIYSKKDGDDAPPPSYPPYQPPPGDDDLPEGCREISPGLYTCEYIFKGTNVREWEWILGKSLECISLQGLMVCGGQSVWGNIVKINVHDVIRDQWRTVFFKDGAKGNVPFSATVGIKLNRIKFIIEPDFWIQQGFLDDVQVSGTFLEG